MLKLSNKQIIVFLGKGGTMANKERAIKFSADKVNERLRLMAENDTARAYTKMKHELVERLGIDYRSFNRYLREEEMPKDTLFEVANFLDVNYPSLLQNPAESGFDIEMLDGMSYADQVQMYLKEMDSQKRLFYVLLRFCGLSQREIDSFPDDSIAPYMNLIGTFIESEVIDRHFEMMKNSNPQMYLSLTKYSDDSLSDRRHDREQVRKKKSEKVEKQRKQKIARIDKGRVMALHNAGWKVKQIASELDLEPQDIQAVIETMKGGVSGK